MRPTQKWLSAGRLYQAARREPRNSKFLFAPRVTLGNLAPWGGG